MFGLQIFEFEWEKSKQSVTVKEKPIRGEFGKNPPKMWQDKKIARIYINIYIQRCRKYSPARQMRVYILTDELINAATSQM